MFTKKNPLKSVRMFGLVMLVVLLTALLAACGDPTATTVPAATTAPATTTVAPKSTTAAATTAVATTAAAPTTTVATTTAAAKVSMSKLRLGLIPSENATKVIDDSKPFGDALSKVLGVPVEIFVGNNYTATIEALASNKIDVAWFGPFSYVLSADKYNGEALLLQLGKGGATTYNSYIITTPKTGIKTLADLKGHTFSFVDPASTSGNLIPRYTLTKAGFDPDKDVQPSFAGGHDASLLGVISGKTDAGAVASDVFASLLEKGSFKKEDVVIVNTSDPIPNSPIAVSKTMAAADKAAIKAAFLSIKDADVLKAVGSSGFADGSNDTYNGLRDVAKLLGLDLTKLK